MRIKKFIVVVVSVLFISMLPFEHMGAFMAKAAGTQDITVEVTKNIGMYNQVQVINVRIINISKVNTVDNATYAIRESNTILQPTSGKIATLSPGASQDITLIIPVGTSVGEYVTTLDITYVSVDKTSEQAIQKVYSKEFTAIVQPNPWENPEQPIKPQPPVEPEQPVKPQPPVEPEQPVKPQPPVEPEQPVKPQPPVEPEQPAVPEQPVVPESPAEPEVPNEPETPKEPQENIIEEIVNKIISGIMSLKKDTAYQLDEGNWSVEGDPTVYTGGITFYVDEDGEYEFKQK